MRQGRGSEGVWERGHTLELPAACSPGCLPNRIPKCGEPWVLLQRLSLWMRVFPRVTAENPSLSHAQEGRGAEQAEESRYLELWTGSASPASSPNLCSSPSSTCPFTQVTICLLSPWLDRRPPLLPHSISAHLPTSSSGASSPKETPNQSSYFRLPQHLSVTQE